MNIREAINEHSLISAIMTGVVVLAIVIFMMLPHRAPPVAKMGSKSYFSIDDGKTWFADDSTKLPPFEYEGKPAYKVYVFTCDGGKTKWVARLERYTPQRKSQLEASRKEVMPMDFGGLGGIEVKLPGAPATAWINESNPGFAKLVKPKCPDGSTTNLQPVYP